jgi:hypothetical protein
MDFGNAPTMWYFLFFSLYFMSSFSEGIVCPRGFFQCNEGHCVPSRLVFDGTKHCVEGDDELNCGKTNVLNNVTH